MVLIELGVDEYKLLERLVVALERGADANEKLAKAVASATYNGAFLTERRGF